MTANKGTLTLNLDSSTLLYFTKLFDLFEKPATYENGAETLETIKDQLNSLKNVKLSTDDISKISFYSSGHIGNNRI